MLSPEGRSERARIAALTRHAQHDTSTSTTAARAAITERYRHQVDPDQTLDPDERDRRARRAMCADLARGRLRAAQQRATEIDRLAGEILAEVQP